MVHLCSGVVFLQQSQTGKHTHTYTHLYTYTRARARTHASMVDTLEVDGFRWIVESLRLCVYVCVSASARVCALYVR